MSGMACSVLLPQSLSLSSSHFVRSVSPLQRAAFILRETAFPQVSFSGYGAKSVCFESFCPVHERSGLHWSALRGSDAQLRFCCPLGSVCPVGSCGDSPPLLSHDGEDIFSSFSRRHYFWSQQGDR